MHRNNARVACIKIIRNLCTSHSHSHSNRQWKIFFRAISSVLLYLISSSIICIRSSLLVYVFVWYEMNVDLYVKGFLALCAIIFSATMPRERENSKRHLYGLNVKCTLTLSQNKMISFVRDGGEIYTYTRSHRNEEM